MSATKVGSFLVATSCAFPAPARAHTFHSPPALRQRPGGIQAELLAALARPGSGLGARGAAQRVARALASTLAEFGLIDRPRSAASAFFTVDNLLPKN